jgi:hypothetical protein
MLSLTCVHLTPGAVAREDDLCAVDHTVAIWNARAQKRRGPYQTTSCAVRLECAAMSDTAPSSAKSRRHWRFAPLVVIAITLVLCGSVLGYRNVLYGRLYAQHLTSTSDPVRRVQYALELGELGDSAWWGARVLCADAAPDVRQCAAIALQRIRTPWATAELRRLSDDPDAQVRAAAVTALEARGVPCSGPAPAGP